MRYNLPLDENMDADIIEWLDSIPKKRRAEQVRAVKRTLRKWFHLMFCFVL